MRHPFPLYSCLSSLALVRCPKTFMPLGLGFSTVSATDKTRVMVPVQERIRCNFMAVWRPALRHELRASFRVKLRFRIWSQGLGPSWGRGGSCLRQHH